MSKLTIKKTKYFWALIVGGCLSILLAIFLAPFWGEIWVDCPWQDLGITIVSIAMAALVLLYIFGFVLKKIINSKGIIQILTVIEFTLLFLIALGLVFAQFKLLNIPDEPSIIVGIAFYIRGVIEIFRAYFHKTSSTSYPIWWLVISILFVTLGVIFMLTSSITKVMILWILVISMLVAGILLIVYGLLSNPKKTKKK